MRIVVTVEERDLSGVTSRNVKGYVRAVDRVAALRRALSVALTESTTARSKLTGGQLGAATRILGAGKEAMAS